MRMGWRDRILSPPGTRVLLLGNEAIARGALEAGVSFAAGYPGTPSSEILGSLARIAARTGLYVEWSTNEKVALEAAVGAALAGARALATMKHVGVNVAADTLVSLGYSGLSGLVIVSADDPGMWSSQNEQDNRVYGELALLPVIEPYGPQEALEATRLAYEVSGEYDVPVILRTTTRVSHTMGDVVVGELAEPVKAGVPRIDRERFVLIPANARKRRRVALDRLERMKRGFSNFPLNRLTEGSGRLGIIVSGAAVPYVEEAVELLGVRPHVLRLATTHPVPEELVLRLATSVEEILVVEELEPFVETRVRAVLNREGVGTRVRGKDVVPRAYELDTGAVVNAISEVLGLGRRMGTGVNVPVPRAPVFCPGCPHRASFLAIRRAIVRAGVKPVFSGDIGCYSLGYLKPFRAMDTLFSMGASMGVAHGISKATGSVTIALIGDSTFFHAGLPGLVNAVYNGSPVVTIVFDNRYTAMTGLQPHPATGMNAMGEPAPLIRPEEVARAIGVEVIEVENPLNFAKAVEKLVRVLKFTKETGRPSMMVFREPCALSEQPKTPFYIDREKCIECMACVVQLDCPPIHDDLVIDEAMCTGCSLCAQICPVGAIVRR